MRKRRDSLAQHPRQPGGGNELYAVPGGQQREGVVGMANSQGMAVETVAVEQGARAALPQYRTRSMLSITLRRLARSYSALWGLCMVCGLILLAVLAGVIAPYGPAQIVPGSGSLDLPTWAHPMGLDLLGRDVFSRVMYSSRIAI